LPFLLNSSVLKISCEWYVIVCDSTLKSSDIAFCVRQTFNYRYFWIALHCLLYLTDCFACVFHCENAKIIVTSTATLMQ